jgi:hypothetical protein
MIEKLSRVSEEEEWVEKLEEKTLHRAISPLRSLSEEPWVFKRIKAHVETHKYLLEEKRKVNPLYHLHDTNPVTIERAFNDWTEYVFEPIIAAVESYEVARLQRVTTLVAFIHVSDRWMYMKKAIPYEVLMLTASHAAAALALEAMPKGWSWKKWRLQRFLRHAY